MPGGKRRYLDTVNTISWPRAGNSGLVIGWSTTNILGGTARDGASTCCIPLGATSPTGRTCSASTSAFGGVP
eukprot:5592174-Pyramimonas_sp.AAC.1